MSGGDRGRLALALALIAIATTVAQARELGVWVQPAGGPPVTQALQDAGWSVGPARPAALLAGTELIVASFPSPVSDEQLFDTADALLALIPPQGRPPALAAGELVDLDSSGASLYLGFLVAETRNARQLDELRAWVRRHRFAMSFAGRGGNPWIVEARRSAGSVLAAVATVAPGGFTLEPVVIGVPLGGGVQSGFKPGGFQQIPGGRNLLAATIVPGETKAEFVDKAISIGGTEIFDWPAPGVAQRSDVVTVRFDTAELMMDAQKEIRQDALDSVRLLGPAVYSGKLRVLSNRLVLRFTSPAAQSLAQPILAYHNLSLLHEIPWLENAAVYEQNVPIHGPANASYALYDAARDVLDSGLATLALPDTYLWAADAGPDDDCTYDVQEYLAALEEASAVKLWKGHGGKTRIGIVDRGFRADYDYCTDVNAKVLLDSSDQETFPFDVCYPPDPTFYSAELAELEELGPITWCTGATCFQTSDGTHGEQVSMIAAAIHDPVEASGSPCDAPRGTIDGAELILIRRADNPSEYILSSLLVWAAGAEPGHTIFGSSLPPEFAASVLNLSFHLVYANAGECDPGRESECTSVCATGDDCTLLGPTLDWLRATHDPSDCPDAPENCIREGGVLVVNARAHRSNVSDLDGSESTTSIATVTHGDGNAKDSNDYFHHDPTPYTAVVAPLGGDGDTPLGGTWGPTGNSSAAAGAVSGIAAMMFDVNPALTAQQAACLLNETASTRSDPGQWWTEATLQSWTFSRDGTREECRLADPQCDPAGDCEGEHCAWTDDCRFRSGFSYCVGHGLVHAANAVQAAIACAPAETSDAIRRLLDSCPCQPDGQPVPRYLAPFDLTHTILNLDEGSIPSIGMVILECLLSGECECFPNEPCLFVEIRNPHDVDYTDIRFELVDGDTSWPIPGEWPEWPAGSDLLAPLPVSRPAWSAWRESGEVPRIRAFSGEHEIVLTPDEPPADR